MASNVNTWVLDNGLTLTQADADKIYITSQEATTYTEATSTYALGNNNFGAGSALTGPASGSPNGRKLSSVAITAGSVTATATATNWAIVDSANTRLLAVGALSASQAVTNGNTFTLGSFDVRLPNQ